MASKVVEIKIVCEVNTDFENKINELIDLGWELHGDSFAIELRKWSGCFHVVQIMKRSVSSG